jgi:hypothetical protein
MLKMRRRFTMKPSSIILSFVLASSQVLYAHKQHVHQYIVREAYHLLRTYTGKVIPVIHDHIGGLESFYAGDSAWQRPFVTTGAWREDEEDVVYGYRNISPFFKDLALVSITHFWNADKGNFTPNKFRIHPNPLPLTEIGPFENAYQKLLEYATGGWVIWYPRSIVARNSVNGHPLEIRSGSQGIPVVYHSLAEFYKSKILHLRSDQGPYTVFDVTERKILLPGEVSKVLVDDDTRNRLVWEILGRMCHLLGDLSVPAHTHGDEHGLDHDDYEEWMGGETHPYLEWNCNNVGNLIDPTAVSDDPLHYLMYTMQQRADRFESNGPFNGEGNDHFVGNPRLEELISLASSIFEVRRIGEPWSLAHLEDIRDDTLPYAIRATAALLYWFANATGLLSLSIHDIVEQSKGHDNFLTID